MENLERAGIKIMSSIGRDNVVNVPDNDEDNDDKDCIDLETVGITPVCKKSEIVSCS